MQVCPGCHTTFPQQCPVTPTATPALWHQPGVVQPPYVCGRMFQMTNLPGAAVTPSVTTATGTCQVTSPVNRCIVVPTESCHVLCYLTCAHNCSSSSTTTAAFRSTACPSAAINKLTCHMPDIKTSSSSLHTSGGGLMETDKTASDNCRSLSPDTKVNYPVSLNPFLNSSSCQLTTSVNKELIDPESSLLNNRISPSPDSSVECLTWTAAGDSRVLMATRNALEESGWYYGALSWQQAATMLQNTEVGTFLIRDSASPQCLYSLSVQTINGPTSVRIHYSFGKFRLDCAGHSQKLMPEFGGLVELVEHYIHANSSQVWVDHEGKTFSPINIKKPLRRTPPSLQHLCRLAINCSFPKMSTSGLPHALKGFLKSYPHTC